MFFDLYISTFVVLNLFLVALIVDSKVGSQNWGLALLALV